MKKLIFGLLISLVSFSALALNTNSVASAGFEKLSDTEKAEIIKMVAAKASASPTTTTVETVDKWVDVGERIGKMLGGAAKEIGVAVNDFVATPVGQMTMMLVIWHYMGGALVHLIGGVVVLVVGLSIIWYAFRNAGGEVVKYDPEKRDLLGRSVVISRSRQEWSSDAVGGFLFCSAVVLVAALITTFTF